MSDCADALGASATKTNSGLRTRQKTIARWFIVATRDESMQLAVSAAHIWRMSSGVALLLMPTVSRRNPGQEANINSRRGAVILLPPLAWRRSGVQRQGTSRSDVKLAEVVQRISKRALG
jgi:hypothetical protein